jgi:hypothetical protein
LTISPDACIAALDENWAKIEGEATLLQSGRSEAEESDPWQLNANDGAEFLDCRCAFFQRSIFLGRELDFNDLLKACST